MFSWGGGGRQCLLISAPPLLYLMLHSAHHKDSISIRTLGNWNAPTHLLLVLDKCHGSWGTYQSQKMSTIEKILSQSERLSFPMNWLKQILWAENPLHSQQHRQLLYSENLHETPTLNSSKKVSRQKICYAQIGRSNVFSVSFIMGRSIIL